MLKIPFPPPLKRIQGVDILIQHSVRKEGAFVSTEFGNWIAGDVFEQVNAVRTDIAHRAADA